MIVRLTVMSLLSLVGCLSFGCEQRVVRTENPYVGSQYEMADKVQVGLIRPSDKPGPLEAVGDLLFGWADDDDPTIQREADISSRVSRPQTSASQQGQ